MGNLMFFFVLDIFGGRKGLSSNKKLNPTSFSAAFSAFQLWSFDVLFDFPVIVYFSPWCTTFTPPQQKPLLCSCYMFCLFVFVFLRCLMLVFLPLIWRIPCLFGWLAISQSLSLSLTLTHCFTVLFVSILNIKQLTHTHTNRHQQKKIIVITVDYQQFPLCTN